MKPQLIATSVITIATFAFPSLSASAQTDPMSTVQQFIEARNKGDEPGAMALVADEINYVEGSTCPVANPCTFQNGVHAFISDHSRSALVGSPLISGTTVSVRVETSNDAVRAVGLERIVYDYTLEVQDGKLTSLRGVPDTTDPQTAAFQAAFGATRHLDVSARTHDDWALAPGRVSLAHHASPREHDEGAVASPASLPLELSARSHDDWAVAPGRVTLVHHASPREHDQAALDLSPRRHDGWALEGASTTPAVDLSPASHDDWAL